MAFISMLPEHGGVLELWQQSSWMCYETMAALWGRSYARWENRQAGAVSRSPSGEVVRVEVNEFQGLAKELLQVVAEHKRRNSRASLL